MGGHVVRNRVMVGLTTRDEQGSDPVDNLGSIREGQGLALRRCLCVLHVLWCFSVVVEAATSVDDDRVRVGQVAVRVDRFTQNVFGHQARPQKVGNGLEFHVLGFGPDCGGGGGNVRRFCWRCTIPKRSSDAFRHCWFCYKSASSRRVGGGLGDKW